MGMFDNAKTVNTGSKKKAAEKKASNEIAGIKAVACLDVVIKALTAIKKTKDGEVKETMTGLFIDAGVAKKARPANFKGVEDNCSASCEMRARASTSPLSEDEIALFTAKGLPMEEVVDTVETYIINPDYLADPKIMASIEAALKKVKGIPDDLFLKQEGKSKTILAEGALDVLFAQHDEDTIADLLPMTTSLAIKPKMEADDIQAAFDVALKMLTPAKADAKAAKAA